MGSPVQPIPAHAPDDMAVNRAVSAIPDIDPTLLSDMDKVLGTGPTPPPPTSNPSNGGKLAAMWAKVQDYERRTSIPALSHGREVQGDDEIVKAVGRGILNAVDEVSNTVVGAGVGLSKMTGAYKLGRSPEEQDAFLKWQAKPTSETNPFHVPQEIRDYLGPSKGGVFGLIEGASQFTAGMFAAGKYAEGFQSLRKLKNMGAAGYTAAKEIEAFITNAVAFDPHQPRLSNLLAEYLDQNTKQQP